MALECGLFVSCPRRKGCGILLVFAGMRKSQDFRVIMFLCRVVSCRIRPRIKYFFQALYLYDLLCRIVVRYAAGRPSRRAEKGVGWLVS